MSAEDQPPLPRATHEGEIMGIRVAVLEDGTRVINAEDLALLFERVGHDIDPVRFAEALRDFGKEEGK